MLLQNCFNIALLVAQVFVLAISFSVIYQTVRFFHFAHGIVYAAGAYFVFAFCEMFGLPLLVSCLLAIPAAVLLGCLMEFLIYRPLRGKGASPLIFLLTSLGIYIVLQNVISMVFGDETRSIRTGVVQEGYDVLGARITGIQVATIFVSAVLVTSLWGFLKFSKMGKAMRAVACDPKLADISGIDSGRVILWAFGIGSGLAAVAGILVALDVDMTPTMGMHALMMGVVVVIIGGVGSIGGIVLGALLLGMAQHFGAWYIGSQWQDAIAFVILVVFLLVRPEGFMGKKVKSATV